MLIIPIKEGENIDRALKRFKRKFDKTGTKRSLQTRKQFNESGFTAAILTHYRHTLSRLDMQSDIIESG